MAACVHAIQESSIKAIRHEIKEQLYKSIADHWETYNSQDAPNPNIGFKLIEIRNGLLRIKSDQKKGTKIVLRCFAALRLAYSVYPAMDFVSVLENLRELVDVSRVPSSSNWFIFVLVEIIFALKFSSLISLLGHGFQCTKKYIQCITLFAKFRKRC